MSPAAHKRRAPTLATGDQTIFGTAEGKLSSLDLRKAPGSNSRDVLVHLRGLVQSESFMVRMSP